MKLPMALALASLSLLLGGRVAAEAPRPAAGATDVPVPTACTPAVNQRLEDMVKAHRKGYTENVMVCGIATGTTVNRGGAHGSHHLITLQAVLPGNGTRFVQIAINDTLDGVVSAKAGQSVFAFGQGYVTGGKWVAGVHDVHCSTHPTADNGWVVVDGTKTPTSCPSR